jgi:hypothetical protein
LTNTGYTPVQIGDIHLGYRSMENDDIDSWYWLKEETVMLEDYWVPLGEDGKKQLCLKTTGYHLEKMERKLFHS